MTEFSPASDIHELRAAHAEFTHRPGGVLHEIAKAAITQETDLHPKDVADIIMPPKQPGDKYDARWELIEGADGVIMDAAGLNAEQILQYAELLDLRKAESVDWSDIRRIDSKRSAWMIEGGANRTSVVRRALTVEAMKKKYGEDISDQTMYQFGSDRPIPRMRKDPKTQELKPNAEYEVAQEIAGNYLPEGDTLTEFGLNLAGALQAGYEIVEEPEKEATPGTIERLVILKKENWPRLLMIQPLKEKGGLIDGINAAHEILTSELAGQFVAEPYFQPVIATNGQYRAKDELQASLWAKGKGISILEPVALGDEPGFTAIHPCQVEVDGQLQLVEKAITTAERAPMAYVNEIVILNRLNS